MMTSYPQWLQVRAEKYQKKLWGNPGCRRELRVTEEGMKLLREIMGRKVLIQGVRTRTVKLKDGIYPPIIKKQTMEGHIFKIHEMFKDIIGRIVQSGKLKTDILFRKIWVDGSSLYPPWTNQNVLTLCPKMCWQSWEKNGLGFLCPYRKARKLWMWFENSRVNGSSL